MGIKDSLSATSSEFSIVDMGENINILANTNGSYFFTSKQFNSTINDLTKRFDQVFVCSSNSNAQLGLMALVEFVPSLVLIAGLRKTKKIDIKNIKIKQSIDVLFYE